MSKKYSLIGPILMIILLIRCGLFEPDKTPGSLRIILVREETKTNLEKAAETLSSVQCIMKKGSETKYDGNLTNQGGSFHGEIKNLDPGSDYSVLLYGKNSSSEIIARGYKSGISVSAGNTTTVEITWGSFQPVLSTPANGRTNNDNKPAFSWSSVSGATVYELVVDNNSSFSSPEIDQTNLTSTGYTATDSLSDGSYYWKVRCKDSLGNWGGWSEAWSFTINTKSVIVVSSDPLAFGSVTLGQSKDLTLSISNTGNATLSVTGITSTNAQFTIVGSTTFSVTAGSYQDVTVRFTPGSTGSQSGTLHIANNSTMNPKDVSLSGTGTAIPTPVISVVASLDFGSVEIADYSDQTLWIYNTGDVMLNITNIYSTNDRFLITGNTIFNITAGDSQNITIRFIPDSKGYHSGILMIYNNSSESPKEVHISGSGRTTIPVGPYKTDYFTLGLWHFDEIDGNVVYDSSDSNMDGTLIGDVFHEFETIDFELGSSLRFSGQTGICVIKPQSTIRIAPLSGGLTIETWFSVSNWPMGKSILIKRGNSHNAQFEMYIDSTSTIVTKIFNDQHSSIAITSYSIGKINISWWYHVALICDPDTISLYVNGILIDKKELPGFLLAGTNPNVAIDTLSILLGNDWERNQPFNGYLDEVRLSSIARQQWEFNVK